MEFIPPPFTPLQELAADVNEDTSEDLADVILIRQFLAFIPTPNWTAPDWLFEAATVNIDPAAGVTTKNIKGICTGDANSDNAPPPVK